MLIFDISNYSNCCNYVLTLAIFRFFNRISWLCVRMLPFAILREKSLNFPNTESFENILLKVV